MTPDVVIDAMFCGLGLVGGYVISRHFYRIGLLASRELHSQTADIEGSLSDRLSSKPKDAAPNPNLEILVRSVLGAQVNGRGYVDRSEAFRDLYRRIPSSEYTYLPQVFEGLKAKGIVTWNGPDVADARWVRLLPIRG